MAQARSEIGWLAVQDAIELHGSAALDVLDLGGGTGGAAVRLASEGHRVTVVDPSPDALAALARRADEAGVWVDGLLGDAGELAVLLGTSAADLVLCHGVLDVVDDPAAVLAAVRAVLRPGGLVSLVVASRLGSVLSRVVAGELERAEELLGASAAAWDRDRLGPRRFTIEELSELCAGAALAVRSVRGLRTVLDLVPGHVVDADGRTRSRLVELDRRASGHRGLIEVSSGLHCVAGLD